jgi:uncharacterized protein involved in exopolysaccharide biosynthesis
MEQSMEFQGGMALRAYIEAIWKWLWLILLGTLLAGGAAAIVSFNKPPVYEAKAGVVIVESGYAFTFEPKIRTLSEDELSAYQRYLDRDARRTALVGLVENGDIAAKVIEMLGSELSPEEQKAGVLLGMVEGEAKGEAREKGDLIEITVRASDPQKAMRIANAWAEVYEGYVNELYGGDVPGSRDTIEEEAARAKADYENAEAALIRFLGDNQIDELDRQIEEKQQIIASLQSGKQTAVTTVIDTELQARSKIIAEYINTQTDNRLTAFRKEQEGKSAMLASYMDAEINNRLIALNKEREAKSKLFSSYVDAEINAHAAVFDEQVEAKLQTLSDYYAAKSKVERLIDDAKALREQVNKGGISSSSAANGLAIMLLKAEAFASSADLPGDLQIHIDSISSLTASPEEQMRDLDALINVLEARAVELEEAIDAKSLELLNNEGYRFLATSSSEDDPLSKAIEEKYFSLYDLGDLATLSEADFSGSPLFEAIKQKYPDLFEIGDLSELTESVSADNPLAVVATEKSQELLQLRDLEALPAYAAAAEPLTRAIDKLEDEIDQLQAQLEQENATKQELVRARDLAWETYSTLARKMAEVSISSAVTGTEVKFAISAVEPTFPIGPSKKKNIVLAGIVGLMLSGGLALLLEYMGVEPRAVVENVRRPVRRLIPPR